MNINSGCCCCAARTCLIIWTSITIVIGTLQTLFFLDFDTSPGSAAVVLVNTLAGIGFASFILFAAYKMDQKLLRIAFWVQIANMGISAVLLLINAIFLNPPGKSSGQEIGIGYRFIIAFVTVLLFSIIQGLLAWTIKKTLKEAEEAGTPEQGAYVPGMPNM